jgi:hypothetical protein
LFMKINILKSSRCQSRVFNHCYAGSIPFTLQISFYSFSAKVIDSPNASNFTSFVFSESRIPRPCQLCCRDCPYSLWLHDSSTYKLHFTTFMKFGSHYSSCASSFTPFALSESHDRFAPGIIRLTNFNALRF